MSRDILTLYEARVRKFDQSTGVATVVMPGPYGMEPIEAPPFARGVFDPYTIEPLVVGDRVLVTMSENQPPEWISSNSDWMAKGDDRWVDIYGDRMTGTLEIVAGIESLRLARYGFTTPHMGFYNDDFTTRYGYIMGTPTDLRAVSTSGTVSLWGAASVSLSATGLGVTIPNPNILDFGATTRQMLNLYGSTYAAGVQGSTLFLRTGGGFNIYRGGVFAPGVADPGGGVNVFTIRSDGVIEGFTRIQGVMRPQTGAGVWGSGSSYIAFYNATTDPDALGTRTGYVGFSGTDMYLNNENGVNTRIASGSGVLLFIQNVTEVSRIEPSGQAWGRTIGTYNTTSGFDIRTDGRFISSMDGGSAYNWMINMGAADTNGGVFLTLRRGTPTAAQIGSITQVSTTGVNFNQTSHGPWKGNVRDLDDDEALERLARWRPVAYQWKFDADGMQDEEGTPSGDIQHGFIAQELYEVQPTAVTKGFGVQTEEKVWAERKANHEAAQAVREIEIEEWEQLDPETRSAPPERIADFDEPDPFMPWGQDNSKLVPDMVAAMQAILRKVEAQEDEIAALRDEVALLRSAPGGETS